MNSWALNYDQRETIRLGTQLLPLLQDTLDFSGKRTVRKEIQRAPDVCSIGYGTTMMTWRTESWFIAVGKGTNQNMSPQGGDGPKIRYLWGSVSRATKTLSAKTHILCWRLEPQYAQLCEARLSSIASGESIRRSDMTPIPMVPTDKQGARRKKHSWAIGGRWIDDKHATLVPDVDVPVRLHICVVDNSTNGEDSAIKEIVQHGTANARTLATKPSLDALLSAVGNLRSMRLPVGSCIYFSTSPVDIVDGGKCVRV